MKLIAKTRRGIIMAAICLSMVAVPLPQSVHAGETGDQAQTNTLKDFSDCYAGCRSGGDGRIYCAAICAPTILYPASDVPNIW